MVIQKIKELISLAKQAKKLKIPNHNLWLIEYLADDEVIYIGWVYGYESEIKRLKEFGVKGPLKWKPLPEYGSIERCVITKEVAEKLKESYPNFRCSLTTFTGIDKNGNQVSWGGDGIKDG